MKAQTPLSLREPPGAEDEAPECGNGPSMASLLHNEMMTLLDVARFGACVAAADGKVTFWNRRAAEIVGLSASEVVGRPCEDVIRSIAAAGPSTAADLPDEPSGESQDGLAEAASARAPLAVVPVALADPAGVGMLVAYLFDGSSAAGAPESPGRTAAGSTALPASIPDAASATRVGTLSPREKEVLRHVAAGARSEQIAEDLGISLHTVRNHVRGLRTKLGARTKLDAVVIAMREGLL